MKTKEKKKFTHLSILMRINEEFFKNFFTTFFAFLVKIISMEALIDEIPNFHSPRFDAISTISNSSCSQLIKLMVYYTSSVIVLIYKGEITNE